MCKDASAHSLDSLSVPYFVLSDVMRLLLQCDCVMTVVESNVIDVETLNFDCSVIALL
jgi:hypothetical protein